MFSKNAPCAALTLSFAIMGCGSIPSGQVSHLQNQASSTSPPLAVLGELPLAQNPHISLGMPSLANQPAILISRRAYALSWNASRRNINWAAWRLQKNDMGSVHRQDSYAADADLKAYFATHGGGEPVGPNDYRNSCFDRGHQVPSADRTATVAGNAATFAMTNMLPQTAYLNRGIWEHLEAYSRALVAHGNSGSRLYVIAGPIYDTEPQLIGPHHDIAVPASNFKIVVEMNGEATPATLVAAVIMPNVTSTETDPVNDYTQACADANTLRKAPSQDFLTDDWKKYQVPLAKIEEESGLDVSYLQQNLISL